VIVLDKNNGIPTVLKFSELAQGKMDESLQSIIKNVSEKGKQIEGDPSSPREVMRHKINQARAEGLKEIETFEKAVEEFTAQIEDLEIFGIICDFAKDLFVDSLAEGIIRPVLLGRRIMGMPEEQFQEMRRDMYKMLIDRYCKED
jgi:hypothetical protein